MRLNAFAHTQEKHESPLASLLAGWDGKAGDCIGEWEGAIHEADRNARADRAVCDASNWGSGVPAMWALYLQCTKGTPSYGQVAATSTEVHGAHTTASMTRP